MAFESDQISQGSPEIIDIHLRLLIFMKEYSDNAISHKRIIN